MFALVRPLFKADAAHAVWRMGAGAVGLAALSACSTVSLQPGAEYGAGAYGDATLRAPVVESSLYSDGRLVAAPAAPGTTATGHAPVGAPIGAPIAAQGVYVPPGTPGAHPLPLDGVSSATPLNGLHLQAGTFSSQTSAENIANNVRSKAPQFAQQVRVLPRGSNWRVVIGPFASDTERAQAANIIRTAIGSDVVNAAP